ncbi:MAG: choice-of-anchor D domain-containing protein, partial [Candidatus Marinimicrobia bacterium]|nr:choice-of-anchor D domain-containing protein [Candidatus Neomarinimicrobiota bacterium]
DSLYTSSDLFTLSIDNSLIETSAILSITYTPVEFGPDTGTAYIKSNDPDEGLVQISLSGFGYFLSPDIELSTNTINFGDVMDGLIETQLLHVYNTGDAALELDTMYCTGNFSVMPSNGTVNIGDTLTLEVTFAPDDETSFAGTMTIVTGNDPDEDTLMVSLSGTGTQQSPIMELSDDSLYFGVVVAGQTVTRQTTIYNTGMLDLEVEELNMAGSELFTTDFSDATVEPGDSVDVVFQFAPTEQIIEAIATATILASGVANQTVTLEAGYFGPVWHVATTGSDETGDGAEENPYATIQHGIDESIDGDTVLVATGTYVENILIYAKNIVVLGEDRETTIIDGNQSGSVVHIESGDYAMDETEIDSTSHFSGFTIQNGESMGHGGGGIYISGSSPYLFNLKILNNYDPNKGGGIYMNESDPILTNVTITGNTADDGGGIYLENESDPTFTNVTITGNTAEYGGGGGIYCAYSDVNFEMINSIVWNNSNSQISGGDGWSSNAGTILYSDIQGGWGGTDNIDSDPLFCNPDSGDHSLAENSPCIDAGDPSSPYDPDGTITDMGAFGIGCESILSTDKDVIPLQYVLHQNYPNPFNPTTQIKYDLPEDALVAINIYDLMGRSIKSLVNSNQSAGYRSIQWNATNNLGEPVSAGMYIYMIQAGKFSQTKKMVLLK